MRSLFSLLSPGGPRARLTTLIFHRVLPVPDPLFDDEMYAARFDAICSWLAGWFNVLPLDEAVQQLSAGTLPARALCITFDDGYEDNHGVALPILQRHKLPATFFIATGFLDGGRMWNDTVIESVRYTRLSELDLRAVPQAGLDRYPMGSAAERRAAVDRILNTVKYLPIGPRLSAVSEIAERAGVRPRDDLMMSSEQVRGMRRGGMQIGAHTVGHPILATMDDAAIRVEMQESKATLEGILGEAVTLFAYPNGKPGRDYGPSAVAAARELGFAGAVSTAPGVARADSDPYQLPRFTPWDRGRLRFGARIASTLARS
jgi:peptidoglycan/xylan/chitin deacetylase (PgdA/CDA1 family)